MILAAIVSSFVAALGGDFTPPKPPKPPKIEVVKAERDFWNEAASKRRREVAALAKALAEARAEIRRLNAPPTRPTTIGGLGRLMAARGYHVSEHPEFGGVSPTAHSPTSLHYSALAVDVNCDGCPGGETAALDKLAADLRTLPGVTELLWLVDDHYDHLHVGMAA